MTDSKWSVEFYIQRVLNILSDNEVLPYKSDVSSPSLKKTIFWNQCRVFQEETRLHY